MNPSLRRSALAVLLILAYTGVPSPDAMACDLCALYTAVESAKPAEDMVRISVAQQFSRLSRIQDEGQRVDDPFGQKLESSVTQIVASYDFTKRLGAQINVPYIYRRYTRLVEGAVDNGHETGFGDVTLLAKFSPMDIRNGNANLFLQVFGGIKLPTGDSDALGEHGASQESDAEHMHPDAGAHDGSHDHSSTMESMARQIARGPLSLKHEGDSADSPASAIHGHDIALGSGSYDFPFGVSAFGELGPAFINAVVQYTLRTEGDFDYRFANDLLWEAGPGYYAYLDDERAVALRAVLSGEYKEKDRIAGEADDATALTSLFLGPGVIISTSALRLELNVDLPLAIDNSGTQAVADYKLRGAVTYSF